MHVRHLICDIRTRIAVGAGAYVRWKSPDRQGGSPGPGSFAIDGGTLIYGVAEDKVNRTFSLAPQPLNGLAEKIENIAPSSLVDPPLRIICEELPSEADPTRGYLVVHIPASPVAPPGGRTVLRTQRQDQYVLSDPELLRLHNARRSADRDALARRDAAGPWRSWCRAGTGPA